MRTVKMELMTSLLLCTLAVLQTLGQTVVRTNTEIKYNTSKLINQNTINHKKILLNINGPPLVNVISELHSLFVDISCIQCTVCMERAIKAYKTNLHHLDRPTVEELQQEVLNNRYLNFNRDKRATDFTEKHESVTEQINSQNLRSEKSVNINKFKINDEVYALKINESTTTERVGNNKDEKMTTCKIYSVKKSFPCNTPEAELLLNATKRKSNKRSKKVKDKNIVTTTERILSNPVFRKRQVDDSQVPENVMPSIEELY